LAAEQRNKFKRLVEQIKKQEDIFRDNLNQLNVQMATISTQIAPFWAAVQTKIAKDLTHPSAQFQEMDQLLRDLESMKITPKGRQRLHTLLEERITTNDPEVSKDEKESARLMKNVMAKVIIESKDKN
jgi:hypothetical protein